MFAVALDAANLTTPDYVYIWADADMQLRKLGAKSEAKKCNSLVQKI